VKFSAPPAGKAGAVLGLELVDLAAGDLLELGAHGLAGFELLAVHQDGIGALKPAAAAVVIAEDGKLSGLDNGLPPICFSQPAM